MLVDLQNKRVFVKPGKTDFRKSINGLSAIVEEHMKLDPFSGYYFVFCNKRRDRMKILYWDRTGFCLWYKRLEQERFTWPMTDEEVRELNPDQFTWLLRGLDYRKAHQELRYASTM